MKRLDHRDFHNSLTCKGETSFPNTAWGRQCSENADKMSRPVNSTVRGVRGLPMGSGAIESAIRRVVNQRLKGNGITWLKENAEAMLVLRAAALTNRWEQSLAHVRATMAASRRIDWQWSSPDIPTQLHERPAQVKPPEDSPPQPLQTLKNKEENAMAA